MPPINAATLVPTANSPPGQGFDEAGALDAADFRGLGPFSPSHVHLGVVYAKRLVLDDDMARLRFGVRDLFDY
jgi:hypothetical protein